jgi:hypothetical protein
MQSSFRSAWLAGCFTAMLVVPGKPVPKAELIEAGSVTPVAQSAVVQQPIQAGVAR